MRAIDAGRLRLDDPVARWLADWRGIDRESVTVQRSPDAQLRPLGLPAVFSRPHRQAGVPAGDLRAAARIPPALAIRLQRSRVHPPRVHPRGGCSRQRCTTFPGTFDPAASFRAQFQRIASFVTNEPLSFNPPRAWRPLDCADGGRELARTGALRRGGRRKRVGARRRRRACRIVRNGRRRRRIRPHCSAQPRGRTHPRRSRDGAPLHRTRRCPRKFAGARMGHDASDVIVRDEALDERDRPYRLHGDVVVD